MLSQNHVFGPWKVSTQKSHILQSSCSEPANCAKLKNEKIEGQNIACDFCRFEEEIDLPQLPEMTFPQNCLKLLLEETDFGIEFNTLDALKTVDSKNDAMKVAVAEAWRESRAGDSHSKEVIKPFDWTFTTHYKGTLMGSKDSYKVMTTDDRIDIEKLKVKSKISFYEDIILFEDELADNGIAQYSVKIRVMPDSFFILLRFFLRVDNLLVRIIDTRIYHELESSYILREHVTKESKTKDLQVSPSLLSNPQELWDHLPTVGFEYEKVEFGALK